MGFSSEEAAQVLERAFGWRSQVFWRGIKKEEIPDPAQVAATLAFLREDIGEQLSSTTAWWLITSQRARAWTERLFDCHQISSRYV